MKDPQRYALLAGAIGPTISGGDLVMYSDYEALAQECEALREDAERYRRLKTFAHPSYNVKTIANIDTPSLSKDAFLTVNAGTWEAMDAVLDGVVTVNTVNIKEKA